MAKSCSCPKRILCLHRMPCR